MDYELNILYEVNILPRNKQEWVSGRVEGWILKNISHECFISVLLESASLNFDFNRRFCKNLIMDLIYMIAIHDCDNYNALSRLITIT